MPHEINPDVKQTSDNFLSCICSQANLLDAIQFFTTEHRTNQQCMMRFCIAYIEVMSEKLHNRDYDERNIASVEFADQVVREIPPNYRSMPYV